MGYVLRRDEGDIVRQPFDYGCSWQERMGKIKIEVERKCWRGTGERGECSDRGVWRGKTHAADPNAQEGVIN